MAPKQRIRQLSFRRFKQPTVSKTSLFCVLLAGFTLSICPLISFYTDANNPELCFINWRNVLFTGYYFVKMGIALLRSSVRQSLFRFGLRRVVLCTLFISVSSYMIVAVAFDRVALMTWDTFESSFMKTFEENIITINETRKEFTVRDIRTYEPLKLEQHMRYKGEDVRLVCEDILFFDAKVKCHEKQVIWKHNRKRIRSSPRYHIKTIFEEIPKNDTMKLKAELLDIDFHMYQVKSEIDIYLIQEADFGTYSCHIAKEAIQIESIKNSSVDDGGKIKPEQNPQQKPESAETDSTGNNGTFSNAECPFTQVEETSCPCSLVELYLLLLREKPLSYNWNAEIFLMEIQPNRRTISVPVGSIVSTSASYTYHDDRPIDFDHEINGKSFVDTCSGLDQSCSILIYLYWFLWHDGGHFANIPAFYRQQMHMVKGIGGTSWQCVCPYTYGLHKFVFYREFYNTTLEQYQTVGVEYPDSVEIVPERPNILDPYFNGTKQAFPLPETSCWGTFRETVCKYLEEILHNMACNLFYKEKVIVLVMLSLSVFAIIVSKLILVRITNPCINLILGRNRNVTVCALESPGPLAGLANLNNTVLKYDLYISCAPEQKGLAADITEYLKSYGLRVCHCDADILGYEIKTQGLSRLITESWKFLVIVTPEYVNSGLQNNFEMQLILQRLHDGYINDSNIALITSELNLIPDIFESFTIFNWSDENFADVENHLRHWMGSSIFHSDQRATARIIKVEHFRFTSANIVYLSCFCFWNLYMIIFGGTVL